MAFNGYINGVVADLNLLICKARSPIILSMNLDGVDESFLSVDIELTIWKGEYSDKPASPTYTFSESTESFTERQSFNYDLSNYIREELETFEADYGESMAVWCEIYYSYLFARTGGTTAGNQLVMINVVDGWANFLDSTNRTTEQLYLPSKKMYINAGRTYELPILNYDMVQVNLPGTVPNIFNSVKLTYSDGTSNSFNLSTPVYSTQSNSKDLFEPYDLTIPSGSNTCIVECYSGLTATGTVSYTYEFVEKPKSKYDKYEIGFIDRNGTVCYIHTNGTSKFRQSVNRNEYNPTGLLTSTGAWNTSKPQKQLFNVNGVEEFEINTGWVDDDYDEVIREMLLSEYVFLRDEVETEECENYLQLLIDDGYTIENVNCTNNILNPLGESIQNISVKNTTYSYVKTPIVPLDSNVDLMKSINMGMINYTLRFKRAYNQINNLF